jgi:hypothetical protein
MCRPLRHSTTTFQVPLLRRPYRDMSGPGYRVPMWARQAEYEREESELEELDRQRSLRSRKQLSSLLAELTTER